MDSAQQDTSKKPSFFSHLIAPVFGDAMNLKNDALGTLLKKSREGADLVPIRIGLQTLFLLNHPDHVQHVFKSNRHNYVKSDFYGRMRPLLGDGLFTLDGPEWRRQRAASQPAVAGPHLKLMASQMSAAIIHSFEQLDHHVSSGRPIEMTKFAVHLTLDITMRTLFSSFLAQAQKNQLYDAFRYLLEYMEEQLWSPFPAPTWAPSERGRRFRRSMRQLDAILYEIIDGRIANPSNLGDMLDGIIEAEQNIWHKKSRKSLRDQVLSILIASHETVASSMVWMMAILSQETQISAKAIREANLALTHGELAGFDTVQKLPYCQNVFKEILRLYPPAWTFSRKALNDDMLGETPIPRGTNLIVCPYTIQRHPNFWEAAELFDPSRFESDLSHDYAYFPFAGGHHVCLGNRFAMIEGTLILAHLIHRYHFRLAERQELIPVPTTTLRPKGEVFMFVEARSSAKMNITNFASAQRAL